MTDAEQKELFFQEKLAQCRVEYERERFWLQFRAASRIQDSNGVSRRIESDEIYTVFGKVKKVVDGGNDGHD